MIDIDSEIILFVVYLPGKTLTKYAGVWHHSDCIQMNKTPGGVVCVWTSYHRATSWSGLTVDDKAEPSLTVGLTALQKHVFFSSLVLLILVRL